MPTPSSRQAGVSSTSAVRLYSEYSFWAVTNDASPRVRDVQAASTSSHACRF